MSKPSNSIKKVKLPNNTECEIVPDKVGSGTYTASLPTLSADDTLVVKSGKATTSEVGLVKPDGTTITVDNDGTIHSQGGGSQTEVQVDSTSITSGGVANLQTINGDYNASTNKLATDNDIPDVSGLANDSSVVHLTGNESIGGTKNFTGNLQVNGYDAVGFVDVSTTPTIINGLLDMIYPVGSVRLSINAGETAFMGGTWQLVSQGRALFGAGSSSETPNGETYTAGGTKSAGLPNITGEISRSDTYPLINIVASQSGALSAINRSTSYSNSTTSGTATRPQGISFDASNSNSIYGNSTTVQPNAYIVYVYQRTA